jgi:hypothetical protein
LCTLPTPTPQHNPCAAQDTRIGLVDLFERLWGATAAVPGGPRPDVWKAHLFGQWGVVFSGAAGTAFAYEREKSELLFFLPATARNMLSSQEVLLNILDAQWGRWLLAGKSSWDLCTPDPRATRALLHYCFKPRDACVRVCV